MSGKRKHIGRMTQIGRNEQALECQECNEVWAAILQLAAAIEPLEPHGRHGAANDTRYDEAFAHLSGLVENPAVAGGVAQAVRTLWACWAVKE